MEQIMKSQAVVYGEDLLNFVRKLKQQFPHLCAQKIISTLYLRLVDKQQLSSQKNMKKLSQQKKTNKQQIQQYISCHAQQISNLIQNYGTLQIKQMLQMQSLNSSSEKKQNMQIKDVLKMLIQNLLKGLSSMLNQYYIDTNNLINQQQINNLAAMLCDGSKWFNSQQLSLIRKLLSITNLISLNQQQRQRMNGISHEQKLRFFKTIIAICINQRLFLKQSLQIINQ